MITKVKTLAKKLLIVRTEKVTRRKKKKTRMTIAKLFALNAKANAKNSNMRLDILLMFPEYCVRIKILCHIILLDPYVNVVTGTG